MTTTLNLINRVRTRFICIFIILASFFISSCENSDPISFSDRMTNLTPSTGSLSPSFSTLVLLYNLNVGEDVESITLTPTLEGENVTVSVNDVLVNSGSPSEPIALTGDSTEVRVDVVSETIDYNYVVTVIKSRAANAFLSSLRLSQGLLTPELESDNVSFTGYDATVPVITQSINLTATLADPNASLTVNGVDQASGEASPNILLDEGDNAITIVVTAQNEVMTQTYDLNVRRSLAEEFAYHTYVKATNTDAEDQFGSRVAMWGNTLVVSAPLEDSIAADVDGEQADNSSPDTGAAYIYEKDVNGNWQFQSYLKPMFPGNTERFGETIATSNNRIAVASHSISSEAPQGRVIEFRKNDANNWQRWAPLNRPISSTSPGHSLFGFDLVLSHKHLIAGFPGEQSPQTGINGDRAATFEGVTDASAGAVFVYVDSPSTRAGHTIDTYIKASNTGAFDLFGSSIALSGNTLAVGAPGEDSNATGVNGSQTDNSAVDSGAVYIFTYEDGSGWTQQAYIKASNAEEGDGFGTSVSLSGDTLIVGAPFEDGGRDEQEANNKLDSGAAYVFTRNESSNWSQQAYLKPDTAFNPLRGSFNSAFSQFGSAVFVSGDTVLISSPLENARGTGVTPSEMRGENPFPTGLFQAGAVSIFTRDQSNQWAEHSFIKSPNTDESDKFGSDIAVYGDQFTLSARGEESNALFNEGGESDNSANRAGAAYIYQNAPFGNHNLALSIIAGGSINNSIAAINLDTGVALDDCLGNCSQLVARGQTIQLTAIAGVAAEFIGWEGDEQCLSDAEASAVISIPVTAETYCTAVFREIDTTLTISKDASSSADGVMEATISGDTVASCGIGCSSDVSAAIELDSSIQITATAEAGAFVAAWSGDAECQNNATNLNTVTTVNLSSPKTCTALFSFPETRTLNVTVDTIGDASGSVSVLNTSTSTTQDACTSDCFYSITLGHTVQLTPTAGDGESEFIEWSGDTECASNANGAGVTTVRLDAAVDCTAMFDEVVVEDIILTVTKAAGSNADGLVQASQSGDVIVSCDVGCSSDVSAALTAGSTVDLVATPEAGALVSAWSGDPACQANANGDNTNTSTTMTVSKTCTAQFDFIVTHELRLTVGNSSSSTGSISATNTDSGDALADCSTDCSQQINTAQTVQLTPVAGSASEFSHWSGDSVCSESVSDTGITNVLMGADTLCTANFTDTASGGITLTLSKTTDNTSLDGTMSAVPAFTDRQAIVSCGVGCTSATSDTQLSGDQFDIFASPQDGFATIQEWTGDPQCAANASADKTSTRVTLTEAITCTVKFTAPL